MTWRTCLTCQVVWYGSQQCWICGYTDKKRVKHQVGGPPFMNPATWFASDPPAGVR